MAKDKNFSEALWYVGPGQAEIRQEQLSSRAPEHLRVRARYGAISRGTEALIAAGRVPVGEYQRMRGPFMAGNFPFPVKYGYAIVGEVEHGPAEWVGRTVFALHPHQTLFDIPASAAVPVPPDFIAPRAVLTANMETALNATWDAAPGPCGRVVVVGAGVVGALVAFICASIDDVNVTLVDINPEREKLAQGLGVAFALPDNAPEECDFVFHASATAAGLTTALNIAADEATIVELSWYGDSHVPVPLGGAFHSRRLRLVSSQVGRVAPSRRENWSHRRRLEAALQLTRHSCLDVLLDPAVKFHDLPQRIPDLLKTQSGVLCQLIAYP